MPTRHLSDEQRQRYARFSAAPSPDQLARYFHLDRSDREVIDGLRGDHNRLGFALMLGSARFLGAFPGAELDIPRQVTAFLTDQLRLKPEAGFKGYFDRGGQRIRHLALIRERYGFTEFADNGPARFRLTRWLYALCWSGDDHPGPLVERATSWLVVNKVLLPGVTVLERFVGRIRDRSQKRLWQRLVSALDEKQRARIAALFDETNEASFAALDALRTVPRQRSSGELLLHFDRLEAIRAFDLRPAPPKGVPAATLERLARVARAGKPSAIAALQEPRRTATVAALFHTLETAAQDDAAELAEALLTDLVKDAEAAEKQVRLRSLRDLDDAAILLRDMAALVFRDDVLPLDQWRQALFERLPRTDLAAAMAEIDAIARPHDAKPYAELRTRWRRARRLFFNIVTRLQMDAGPGGKVVQEAMRYLANVADWSHATMRDAPTAAIPKAWQPLVLDADGRVVDAKAYVFAVIDAWRAAVKRRDIFASPGTRYGDTAAYSDAVFGLFWLLGYQFSPRLADLGDAKLWRIDRKADYGPFNNLSKGTINPGLIRNNWSDAIRLAGSLKLGHLKAAGIMRTLQVRDKPTTLARALAEIGRIAKTVHILRYIDDPAFRRRILTQLNHTELRHRLGRRIHHGERGEIRSPLQQGQEEQLGSLGLALNAVVHWNAIYMQEAIQQIRADGLDVSNDDLAHLSPLIWRHLNFLGRYDFSLPDTVLNGGLRPLRNPTSAWDF
jgi:TnpA family transposase